MSNPQIAPRVGEGISTPQILTERQESGNTPQSSLNNSFNQVRAAFHRIRSNAAVMSDRVRGDTSRQVAQQIGADAETGLAALHNLMSSTLSAAPAALEDQTRGLPVNVEPSAIQPDVAALIRMLLSLLETACQNSDTNSSHVLRAAVETVQDLAMALDIDSQVTERPTPAPAIPVAQASPDAQEGALDEGADDSINLLDAITDEGEGEPLTSADLLDAVKAALLLSKKRDTVVIGLEELQRRIGHGEYLFSQIEDAKGWRSIGKIQKLAAIGHDLMVDAQDDLLSIMNVLADEGDADHE